MYDGGFDNDGMPVILGQWTGRVSGTPVEVESETGMLIVHFQSDSSVNNIGFHILVSVRGELLLPFVF